MKPRPTTTRSGRSGLCGLEAAQLRVAIFAGIAIAVFSFVTSMALFTTTTPSPAPRRFIVVPDVADERLTAIVATALEAERPVLWTRAAAVASPRTIKPKPGKYPAAVVPLVTQRPVAKASNLIQHEESLDPRAVVLPDFLQKIEGGVVTSKLASRSDMDHDSCKAALGFMAKGFVYHRKSWEFCTIFHVADSLNLLKEGSKALGFAVGTEPLPSAFAARGVTLTLSDMPLENELATSWGKTRQHAASLEAAHKPKILPFEDFKRRATFVPVDMNHVPAALLNESFDFVWSSSSLEHVGSCKRAVRFFKRSLNAVRPDGYVIHTTEIALSSLTDKRHWEICAVLSLVESRGDLAGKGRFVVGFDAAQEPLAMVFAANSTDVLITFPVNSSAYRPQFNMSRQAYLARVRQIETGHNAAPVIAPEDVNSRPDFMWSLAMTSATSCSNALQAVKQNLQLLRPGGVAAFVFSVSLGGDGFDDKTMCVLPYPALLVFAGELRKLGYDVKDPLPQVAEAHQAFDFDSPPYSHVDHMVFSFEGQMVTSSLLVITTKAPATSETTVTDASS